MHQKGLEILDYLASSQLDSGEFKSLCYLPTSEQPEWYYSGKSPFLTSNIAFSLSQSAHPKAKEIFHKSLNFLESLQEPFGLWRYWEHESSIMEYNVPCDLDDTCLVSYLLEIGKQKRIDNKELILANLLEDGSIYTWFLPRKFHLFPSAFQRFLKQEQRKTVPVFAENPKLPDNEPISSYSDSEAAVEVHALLYFGPTPEMQSTYKKVLNEIFRGTFNLEYYDLPTFVYYHFSRLKRKGFDQEELVKHRIWDYIDQVNFDYQPTENYLRYVLNFLTLQNLNWKDHPRFNDYKNFILEEPMFKNGWRPFKYWTSKQRSWWAGSPELTAALYFESISQL